MKRPLCRRASLSRNPFARRARIEVLEDRRLLAFGELLGTLVDPNRLSPEAFSEFGYSVAMDGPYTVVGTPNGAQDAGVVYVFDTSTGALVATLNDPTEYASNHFGYSVAVSGNTIVVGAPYGENVGSAYVFDVTSGSLLWTLSNPTPTIEERFGSSVAISGNTILVTVYGGTRNSGLVYVFDAASGDLLRTLSSPSPGCREHFGKSVAISGSMVVVGADRDFASTSCINSAYVFDAASGNLLWTLNSPVMEGVNFGQSMAISGNTIVVGAPVRRGYASGGGTVYVFDAGSGDLLWTLDNPVPDVGRCFGISVAVSGSTIVVGANGDSANTGKGGKGYVFSAADGGLLRTLNDPNPDDDDDFGCSVAISGRTIVVGAYGNDTLAIDAGEVYLFDSVSGHVWRTLDNPTPALPDDFGCAVAISGNTIVVGADSDETNGWLAGSAYVFDATSGDLLQSLRNPDPDNGGGFGHFVAISGSTIVVAALGRVHVFDIGSDTPKWSLGFGWSVAISGNTIVVGAPNSATGGEAYVYDAASGNLVWTLASPSPTAYGYFGDSVAISGSRIVVGECDVGSCVFDATTGNLLWAVSFEGAIAISNDTVVIGNDQEVRVYDADNGNLRYTLNYPNPDDDSFGFGHSVAISGRMIVVGDPYASEGADGSGSACIFDATSGRLMGILRSPTPATSDWFGCAVSLSDGKALLGVGGRGTDTRIGGKAHLFDVSGAVALPVLSGIEATPLGYLPKQPAAPVTESLAVGDMDSSTLAGAIVQITAGYQSGQDVLLFTNTNTITATWNQATGMLSLVGSDTLTNYEIALRSVKYQNTRAKPNLVTRTISFTIDDGWTNSNLVTRDVVFDPPVLAGIETKPAAYTEKRPAVVVSPKITLKDGNHSPMTGATIQIAGNYQAGQDLLSFLNTKTIAATWDTTTGTLTLTGNDTTAHYQKALRSVKYLNTSVTPSTAARTVRFQVSDGLLMSNAATRGLTVKAVADPPVLSGMESTPLVYVVGSPTAVITSSIAVTDVDSNLLMGATVKIASGYRKGQDLLMFASTSTITGAWNPAKGLLTLTGNCTLAAYEAALRTVGFQSTAIKPTAGMRKITFAITDGVATSKAVTRSIAIVRNTASSSIALVEGSSSFVARKPGQFPALDSSPSSIFIGSKLSQGSSHARQTLFAAVRNWVADNPY